MGHMIADLNQDKGLIGMIVKNGRFLDTPNRGGNDHGFYSSFCSERHHHHHHHHPYRRSEK